jgi:hypothetical protein
LDPKTILFLLGAGIALFTFLFHTRRTTRRALRDDLLKLESERQRAVERLSEPPTARYARALGWGLGRLQRFYGPPFSSQALATPLLAAFCYSWAVFFTLAGFGFGDGTVMGEDLFPKVGNGYTQAVKGVLIGTSMPLYLSAVAFGAGVTIFGVISNAGVFIAAFRAAVFAGSVISGIVSVASVIAVALVVAFAVAVAGGLIFDSVGGFSVFYAVTVAPFVAVAVAHVFTVMIKLNESLEDSIVYILI